MKSQEKSLLTRSTKRALIKKFLLAFTLATFPAYKENWHHCIIARALNAVEAGRIDRLMILMPPRHGKSELASIRFPAWYLGRNPTKNIISCSYNADLASDFGRKTRNLAISEIFKLIFPNVQVAGDSKAINHWKLVQGGGYIAAGVGGTITGRGGDVVIIDDPIKNHAEASSQIYRDRVWDWYKSTAYTRLEKGGAVIVILTHWHEDDLVGRLLIEQGKGGDQWTILKFPAIAEEDEKYRRSGEALWQDKYNTEALSRIRTAIGSANFQALYQQNPTAAGGDLIKREWWQYYKELPKNITYKIQSWDTAFETGSDNDYSVCQTWTETDKGFYLVEQWRGKVEFPELKRQAQALYDKHRPSYVIIEQKASGHSLIQELTRTKLPIKAIKPDKDKIARVNAVLPSIEAGNVYIPEAAAWLADFVDECCKFPNATHDDQVDAMTQALSYMNNKINPSVRWI